MDNGRDYDGVQTMYGTVIANNLQKAYRAIGGRQEAALERWMIYQRSAFIIQRAYREHIEWKEIITYTSLRRVQKSMNFERISVTKKGKHAQGADGNEPGSDSPSRQLNIDGEKKHRVPQSVGQPTSLNFKKCLRNRADFDEKMSVWRAVVELRRGHYGQDTHICLKAMLEAQGDVARAMVLMGDQTYHLKNEGPVALHLQQMFLPFLKEEEFKILSKRAAASPNKKGTGAGLRTVQSLRASASVMPGDDEEESGGLDLSPVVLDAYFSKYFQGRRDDSVAPCQRPQSVSEIPTVKPLPVKPRVPVKSSRAELLAGTAAMLKGVTDGPKRTSVYAVGSRSPSPISRTRRVGAHVAGVRASKKDLIQARMASAAASTAQRAERAAEAAMSAASAALGATGRFGEYTDEYTAKKKKKRAGKHKHRHHQVPNGLYPYDEQERELGDADLLQTLLSIQHKMDEMSQAPTDNNSRSEFSQQ
jgi:hypothetical protein